MHGGYGCVAAELPEEGFCPVCSCVCVCVCVIHFEYRDKVLVKLMPCAHVAAWVLVNTRLECADWVTLNAPLE